MYKHSILSLLMAAALLGSCGSKIDDLESGREESNVDATEANDIVTAMILANGTNPQILVAGTKSKVADASVIFPPGSLAVSTSISIGEAVDRSADILSELAVTTKVQAGVPVYIGPAVGTTVEVVQPATIKLPLPIEKFGTGLTATDSKLVLIYSIYNDGWKSGIIPITGNNLVGAFFRASFSGLGYFQVIYLSKAGVEKETSSIVYPVLGKNDDKITDPVVPSTEPTALPLACYRPRNNVCQYYGASNTGAASSIITECKADGGTVATSCPEASFVASCSYKTSDLKYYFYQSNDDSSEASCRQSEGVYKTTYTAVAD